MSFPATASPDLRKEREMSVQGIAQRGTRRVREHTRTLRTQPGSGRSDVSAGHWVAKAGDIDSLAANG
eukprot:699011-Rhodomonas_salina.1